MVIYQAVAALCFLWVSFSCFLCVAGGVGLLFLLPPLVVEGGTDGGTELRVFRDSESHAVELLHGWEHLAALRQQGEVADEHEILDARFER